MKKKKTTKAKRPRGRPVTEDGPRKMFSIRFLDHEIQQIKEAAELIGQSVASLVRLAALNAAKQITKDAEREAREARKQAAREAPPNESAD